MCPSLCPVSWTVSPEVDGLTSPPPRHEHRRFTAAKGTDRRWSRARDPAASTLSNDDAAQNRAERAFLEAERDPSDFPRRLVDRVSTGSACG
jgi:hypothetical protein